MSALYSDVYNGDSGRSSQALPTSSLEAPWPFEVCNLEPWTSIHSVFHQRTLSLTRNKVGVFHSIASLNWRTDGACQSRVRLVPPALCEQIVKWLVWPPTHGGVPAQQPCPFRHLTASVPTRHRKTSSHRIRTPTEPFLWGRPEQSTPGDSSV